MPERGRKRLRRGSNERGEDWMKGQGDGCKELKTAYKKWTGI